MSLSEKIDAEFKEALKAGNGRKVSVLRMVKAVMKNKEIEKQASLSDDDIYDILGSFVKRGRESIEQFSKGGRTDLVEKEEEELKIIQSYLPQQLSGDEVRKIIEETVDEIGAKGPGDIGKVMKAVMFRVKGRAGGKFVNNLVREILGDR